MKDRSSRPRQRGKSNYAICHTSGKRRYRDGDDAALALRNLRRLAARAELDGCEHRIAVVRKYACSACGGWHLTSQISYESRRAA